MKREKFKEIEDIIKALDKEIKPLVLEGLKLKKSFDETENINDKLPLLHLISILTKTARRHLLNPIEIEGKSILLGTNHQGLGTKQIYYTQLSPFINEGWSGHHTNEQRLRKLLFNQDVVMNLTTVIKKSNQKTFLKAIRILNKYNLTENYQNFIVNQVKRIEIDLDCKHRLEISFDRYFLKFKLFKEHLESVARLEIDFDKLSLISKVRGNNILSQFSKSNFDNLSIRDIKLAFLLTENSKQIIDKFKENKNNLDKLTKSYKKEDEELTKLLNPFLALEKI